MRQRQAHKSFHHAAGDLAAACAPTSDVAPDPLRAFPALLRLRLPAGLPAVVRAAQSGGRAFRLAAELHAPQFGNPQLEMFDLGSTRAQLRFQARELLITLKHPALTLKQ
jgi:hypothetical protein